MVTEGSKRKKQCETLVDWQCYRCEYKNKNIVVKSQVMTEAILCFSCCTFAHHEAL